METGPFTVKLAADVTKIAAENGGEEPFIVISKIGNTEVTPETSMKTDAGVTITLTVTVPDAYVVTNFKVNGSIAPQKQSAAEYTFKMPAATATISGKLTVKTPEELVKITSVFDNTLQELYIAQGNLIDPNDELEINEPEGDGAEKVFVNQFESKDTDYTSTVPFSGYPAVINAVPTETEAGVEITQPDAVPGTSNYDVTITVTAPFWKLYPTYDGDDLPEGSDKNKTKTYKITVTRGAGNDNANLSSLAVMETSIVPSFPDGNTTAYAGTLAANVEKLHISAVAEFPNARVQVSDGGTSFVPASISDAKNTVSLELDAPDKNASKTITVKTTAENGTTTKDYTVTVFREAEAAAGAPQDNATGGIVSTVTINDEKYEIHKFIVAQTTQLGEQTNYTLKFDKKPSDNTIEVLVVAGGGGGGKSQGEDWRAGGGGAGGFIYHPAYDIGIEDKPEFVVKVGAGGAKATDVTNSSKGQIGGDSQFGTAFTAKGGGGGGSHGLGLANAGAAGGSGGGNGGGNSSYISGILLQTAPAGALVLGNAGGAFNKSLPFTGSGGGGAGGAGDTRNNKSTGGSGGVGTTSTISGAEVWYSGGGAGGAEDSYNTYYNTVANPPGYAADPKYGAGQGNDGEANTGDGGSGGGGVFGKDNGGNGGSGIVIVRWPYVAEPEQQ